MDSGSDSKNNTTCNSVCILAACYAYKQSSGTAEVQGDICDEDVQTQSVFDKWRYFLHVVRCLFLFAEGLSHDCFKALQMSHDFRLGCLRGMQ